MSERRYTDRPELYDAIRSEWPYDRDVSFVLAAVDCDDPGGTNLLEVGCGTDEHTRRFVDEGFDADDNRTVFVATI